MKLKEALAQLDGYELSLDGKKWYSPHQLRLALPTHWLTNEATRHGMKLSYQVSLTSGETWHLRPTDSPLPGWEPVCKTRQEAVDNAPTDR